MNPQGPALLTLTSMLDPCAVQVQLEAIDMSVVRHTLSDGMRNTDRSTSGKSCCSSTYDSPGSETLDRIQHGSFRTLKVLRHERPCSLLRSSLAPVRGLHIVSFCGGGGGGAIASHRALHVGDQFLCERRDHRTGHRLAASHWHGAQRVQGAGAPRDALLR